MNRGPCFCRMILVVAGGELFGGDPWPLPTGKDVATGSETSFTSGGPVSEACGQCGVAAVDLCGVVYSEAYSAILIGD